MQASVSFGITFLKLCSTEHIGKTVWLYFVLYLRLLAGKPAQWQDNCKQSAYIYTELGVEMICLDPSPSLRKGSEGVWFLVDSNPELKDVH